MIYDKAMTSTVYIVNEKKILLHKHKKYNTWFPVGGHIEKNEFPHEAAIREAKEEAGLDITILDLYKLESFDIGRVRRLPTPYLIYNENDEEDFLDFIFVGYSNKTVTSPSEGESTLLKWFNKDEIENSKEIKVHIKNTALSILRFF